MQQIMGKSIDPKECLVIEDDPKGVEAGLAAGMIVLHRAIGDDDVPSFLKRIRNYL
jgi:beta-phosphoglucomutase-like phosphatase (HAD superfamily)